MAVPVSVVRLLGLAGLMAAIAVGWLLAAVFRPTGLVGSSGYLLTVTILLAIGLYASTAGISLIELRTHLSTILLAITVGVLLKAVLIGAAMVAVSGRWELLVLGVAVAQIDPLSVAAMTRDSSMSDRAKSILAAWASFDDPVTVLLTAYSAGMAAYLSSGRESDLVGGPGQIVTGLLLNLALAAGTLLVWLALRRLARGQAALGQAVLGRAAPGQAVLGRPALGRPALGGRLPDWTRRRWAHQAVGLLLLVVVAVIAVNNFWMLGLALVGLFLRPLPEWVPARISQAALVVAAVALGLVLIGGTGQGLGLGLVLGVAAFLAQALVSVPLTLRLPGRDRWYLALGQQNGVTAIILALLLETEFPGTVGIVGPAIVVVNILNVIANGILDRVGAHGRDGAEGLAG